MIIQLSHQERGTILAALRVYQRSLEGNGGEPPLEVLDIATDNNSMNHMTTEEIDTLCETVGMSGNWTLVTDATALRLIAEGPGGVVREVRGMSNKQDDELSVTVAELCELGPTLRYSAVLAAMAEQLNVWQHGMDDHIEQLHHGLFDKLREAQALAAKLERAMEDAGE